MKYFFFTYDDLLVVFIMLKYVMFECKHCYNIVYLNDIVNLK